MLSDALAHRCAYPVQEVDRLQLRPVTCALYTLVYDVLWEPVEVDLERVLDVCASSVDVGSSSLPDQVAAEKPIYEAVDVLASREEDMWGEVERVALRRDASAEAADLAVAFEDHVVLTEVVGCAQTGEASSDYYLH